MPRTPTSRARVTKFSGQTAQTSRAAYRSRRPMLDPDLGAASSVVVAGNRQKDLHVGIENRPDDVGGPPVRSGKGRPAGPRRL
jgi:hypothetical protein